MAGSTTTTTHDLTQELQATLNARRDLGTAYDDHFVESFMEKLKVQVIQEVRADVLKSVPAARPKTQTTVETRLRRALISLVVVLLLFLATTSSIIVSHSHGYGPLDYLLQMSCLLLACGIVLYNVFVNLRLRVK